MALPLVAGLDTVDGAPREVDRSPAGRPLEFEPLPDRRNHNVFRYPAKFHPPIARRLVELFSAEGDTILDPFCGSGTLAVEATILNRHSVGTDVDPLAVFVASAKTDLTDKTALATAAASMIEWAAARRAEDFAAWGEFDQDVTLEAFDEAKGDLAPFIPDLPRIHHWFRRRSILQLAAIRREVEHSHEGEGQQFLKLCFASIIRNASNADPVPVSGLEVTSHMLAKEAAGRTVDPYGLMIRGVGKALSATNVYLGHRRAGATTKIMESDARTLDQETVGLVDCVITSPPYLTAVDYYRRHTLEMYWLGLTERREQRLDVMSRYIGRDRVGLRYLPSEEEAMGAAVADRWLPRFPGLKIERERAFRHYCDGMARALSCMKNVVKPNGRIVIVAGDVRFCGVPVSMLELMNDLAGDDLIMTDHLWYPIMNRYMSYARHNQANIAADHVLVFQQRV